MFHLLHLRFNNFFIYSLNLVSFVHHNRHIYKKIPIRHTFSKYTTICYTFFIVLFRYSVFQGRLANVLNLQLSFAVALIPYLFILYFALKVPEKEESKN